MWQYDWQCVSPEAAVELPAQYQQFLDKNFKQYLIICSPGVMHISELKEVMYNTYSNML
jgi:hypothetical protein